MSSKLLKYGEVRFKRETIPEPIRDVEVWPSVDISALKGADLKCYERRRLAVMLYVQSSELSLASIERQTGVHRTKISYFVQRCLLPNIDGRINGFRALIPFAHLQPYRRTRSIPHDFGNRSGFAGAFNLLLEQYPSLHSFLERQLKGFFRPGSKNEFKKNVPALHKRFKKYCRSLGIKANEYPFNTDYQCLRSLGAYVRNYILNSFDRAAHDAGSENSKKEWSGNEADHVRPPVLRPYQTVEFDGHKLHLRVTLTVPDPFGLETILELNRVWILLLIDISTRAVLGYFLSLSKEYNSDEVLEAVQDALIPRQKRILSIPGLTYRDGAGFPSQIFPELAYSCWDWMRVDNAKANLSDQTIAMLHSVVGCWPDAGPSGTPDERPFVERFFQLLTQRFAHRITGSTGSNPQDIIKELADPKGDVRVLMNLDELEDMIDVIIADYNAQPHDGIGGRTPLEAMEYHLKKGTFFLRSIALCERQDLCLLQGSDIVTVRANLSQGIRPHIHFLGVKYSNDILSSNAALIGKKIKIYFKRKDIRTLRAYFIDGPELGILNAARPWFFTPHSIRLRQEILRLKRLKKIHIADYDDAVEVYIKYKRLSASHDKRSASALAKMQRAEREFTLKTVSDSEVIREPKDNTQDILDFTVKPLSVNKTIVL